MYIYIVECNTCKHQYLVSALNFEQRFRVNKSDIKTNKDRCRTATHFNSVYCPPQESPFLLKSSAHRASVL